METIKLYQSFDLEAFLICGITFSKNQTGLLNYVNSYFKTQKESFDEIFYDEFSDSIQINLSFFDLNNSFFVDDNSYLSRSGECVEIDSLNKSYFESEKPDINKKNFKQSYLIVLEFELNLIQIKEFICKDYVKVKPSMAWMYFDGEFVKSVQYNLIK